MVAISFDEIVRSGALDDYQAKLPNSELWTLDAAACREMTCPKCDHPGMDYRPFVRTGSYRVFAVCPACGMSTEI